MQPERPWGVGGQRWASWGSFAFTEDLSPAGLLGPDVFHPLPGVAVSKEKHTECPEPAPQLRGSKCFHLPSSLKVIITRRLKRSSSVCEAGSSLSSGLSVRALGSRSVDQTALGGPRLRSLMYPSSLLLATQLTGES